MFSDKVMEIRSPYVKKTNLKMYSSLDLALDIAEPQVLDLQFSSNLLSEIVLYFLNLQSYCYFNKMLNDICFLDNNEVCYE